MLAHTPRFVAWTAVNEPQCGPHAGASGWMLKVLEGLRPGHLKMPDGPNGIRRRRWGEHGLIGVEANKQTTIIWVLPKL